VLKYGHSMDDNEKTAQNIIEFINTIPFEPEIYPESKKKKKYYHNLSYYEIEYDVDILNRETTNSPFLNEMEKKIKEEMKKCIISNVNKIYEYIGFEKRFESLPTTPDYDYMAQFSKFLNNFNLGYPESDDNEYRYVVEELVNLCRYLSSRRNFIYRNELICLETLALKEEDFAKVIEIMEDCKKNSTVLNSFKNWSDIYHFLN